MKTTYKTKGVCAKSIDFEIKDNKVYNVKFEDGCPGNAIGIANIVEEQDVENVIKKFEGVKCGKRNTSCPDQLAKALLNNLN